MRKLHAFSQAKTAKDTARIRKQDRNGQEWNRERIWICASSADGTQLICEA